MLPRVYIQLLFELISNVLQIDRSGRVYSLCTDPLGFQHFSVVILQTAKHAENYQRGICISCSTVHYVAGFKGNVSNIAQPS